MPEAPRLWRDLLRTHAGGEDYSEVVADLREFEPGALPSALAGVAEALVARVVATGPGIVVPRLVEPMVPAYEAALDAADRSTVVGRLGLVATASLLSAVGRGDDPGAVLDRWLDDWVAAPQELTDKQLTSLALACAALRFDEATLELIGGESEDAFEPGRTFGPNAQGYARYLVAAATAGAETADFNPAWTSFVASFPLRLETGGLVWSDLLWAAYGAYTRVFGYQPGEVAHGLHEFVHGLAEL
jgi:hypothetical protein